MRPEAGSRNSSQSVKTWRRGVVPGRGEAGAPREQVELLGDLRRLARLGSEPSQSPPSGQPAESRLPSEKWPTG